METRTEAMAVLGDIILRYPEKLQPLIRQAQMHNPWFTENNSTLALQSMAKQWLQRPVLENWVSKYALPLSKKTVALVMAGNIPAVGFHDLLAVFLSGHHAWVKLSDKDHILIPGLWALLLEEFPAIESQVTFTDGRLKDFDAVIATGSNNSSRYFQQYFGKYPHIIRQNRNAIAVLSGKETQQELIKLGEDVFTYYGLGCRNVSKIFVPRGYDFTALLEALHTFNEVVLHDKYKNNYDYNLALYMLNRIPFMNNGSVVMIESESLVSRIACLNYAFYEDELHLQTLVQPHTNAIQCVVGNTAFKDLPRFDFGQAQHPAINDYADGVDTMQFLCTL